MEADQSLPLALKTLRDRLGFKIHPPVRTGRYQTFEADLSDWHLKLTDRTPAIWVREDDIERFSVPELADSLRDIVRERRWQNHTILILLDKNVPTLRMQLSITLPTFVIIDADAQTRMSRGRQSPTNVMVNVLLNQIPLSQLAPYETNRPVVGSQFFGRQNQLNRVLTNRDTNYLFVGIRRIGKTSLLKEIKRRMDRDDPPQPGEIRRLYVDCTVISSEEEFLRTLTANLAPSELKMLMGRSHQSNRYRTLMFDRFADLNGGPITFLIDELDRLLSQISDQNALFDVMRAAYNAGKARFVLAGFRQSMQAVTNVNSPFNNFAKDILLGRLKPSDVERMIVGPMSRLRISFESQDLVQRIIRETSGMPNYVQFYCQSLIEILDDENRREIKLSDVENIYEQAEFRNFVIDNFVSNSEPVEQALVYCLISEYQGRDTLPSFTQKAMDGLLHKRKMPLRYRDLDRACANLEVAGIFEQSGREYRFAVPLFHRILLQTRDVDFLFEKAKSELYSDDMYRF